MGSISLDDVDQVEANPSKDWLGVGQEAQACSIEFSTDNDQLNEHDYNYQDNSDLLPFDPDFQNAEAQQIISNLPQLKDCEFDHNYILHHLEQLEIDPTLCSKCSTATKYFASPKPFVQDLYRKSCYWKKNKDTSMDMDIPPYTTLPKPYYHVENLRLKHPAKRPW